jgi:hypothetical protein
VWVGYFANPTFQISWKTSSAGIVKNMGWAAGTYQDSFKGSDGNTVAEKGKYLTVWRKGADGKWKAIHDIKAFSHSCHFLGVCPGEARRCPKTVAARWHRWHRRAEAQRHPTSESAAPDPM